MRPIRTIGFVVATLFLAGCGAVAPASPTAAPPTPTLPAVGTAGPVARAPSPDPNASPTPPVPSGPIEEGTVTRIVDGDTIWVRFAGRDWRVRYIGIDAPELREAVPEPWAVESTAANRQLVLGQRVVLEKDVSETDRFGRLLRYVWLPPAQGASGESDEEPPWVLANLELVRLGYARAISFPPDVRHQEHLRVAEEEAREAGAGLWGEGP